MTQSVELKQSENVLTQKLINDRILVISDTINSKTAKEVVETLLALDATDTKKPIFIFLNTSGGEVNSGFAIFDIIRFVRAPVKIIVTGLAASIGTVILLGAKKENRFILPNAKMLIHQPLIQGSIEGQASDLEIHAKEILATREKIAKLYKAETNQSLEQIQKDMERDHWLTAEEAIQYGFVINKIENWKQIKNHKGSCLP